MLRGCIFNIWGPWLSKLKIWNIALPFYMEKIGILAILREDIPTFSNNSFSTHQLFLNFSIKTSF